MTLSEFTQHMKIQESEAPNLDGQSERWLMDFWNFARHSRKLAQYMFPHNRKGRVIATQMLAHYAANKSTAMSCRERKDIRGAIMYEAICDSLYKRLPKWARW